MLAVSTALLTLSAPGRAMPETARDSFDAATQSLARGDGQAQAVTMAPGGMGAAVDLRLDGAGAVWTVAFDGIKARVVPGGAAP